MMGWAITVTCEDGETYTRRDILFYEIGQTLLEISAERIERGDSPIVKIEIV